MKARIRLSIGIIALGICTTQAQTINDTTISHVTLNQYDQAQADHWGIDETEWVRYKNYMDLEGKYFYEKVDPLTVMALITADSSSRNLYIQKQIQFERQKVGREVALANDAWRIQRAMYGNENLMDFQTLPWMDDELFDRRTIKQDIPNEPRVPANQIISQSSKNITFQDNDELWVVMDESCNRCYDQVSQLTENQPLNVVIVSKIRESSALQNWVKETGINHLVNDGKARLSLYDPFLFPQEPKTNTVFHARRGHILREM